jgi:hypothetical protein
LADGFGLITFGRQVSDELEALHTLHHPMA